jgi:hypothetical protein
MKMLKFFWTHTPDTLPEGAVLRRISWLQRTVRCECYDGGNRYYIGSVFQATLQEWERAID